jgi:hypothetical protein
MASPEQCSRSSILAWLLKREKNEKFYKERNNEIFTVDADDNAVHYWSCR